MALPANFAGYPGEEPHHHFRNVCIDLKKALKSTKDQRLLGEQIDRFKDASKQINWHQKNTGIYRKGAGDKAATKVIDEYNRYVIALASNVEQADPQDVLDAIGEVEMLIKESKAT